MKQKIVGKDWQEENHGWLYLAEGGEGILVAQKRCLWLCLSSPSFPFSLKNIALTSTSFHLVKIKVNKNLLEDLLKELI